MNAKTIRIGFIGLGARGMLALRRYTFLSGVQIGAVCDSDPKLVAAAMQLLTERGCTGVRAYSGEESWRTAIREERLDLVYIATPWFSHAEMAVYGLGCGCHVAVEVPLATTVEECRQVVRAARQSGRQCVMLENCCFDPFTLAVTNMARDGVFGELYHAEGAYIHRLCERVIHEDFRTAWLPNYYRQHTGNVYPTHGLGPVAQMLGIGRGDRFESLVSVSSAAVGLKEYVATTFGESADFRLGDMSNTLIRTQRGATILLQHDITTPRPYSRGQVICGTRGMCQKYPFEAISLLTDGTEFLPKERLEALVAEYADPRIAPLKAAFERIDDPVIRQKHEMDYIMDSLLVESIASEKPFAIDVADGALWSSIIELSERSALGGGERISIPDFSDIV